MTAVTDDAPLLGRGRGSRAVVLLALLFTATAQWSGVFLGPFQLSDIILALTLGVLLLGGHLDKDVMRPTGVWLLLGAVVTSTVLAQFAPPEPTWLTMRFSGFSGTATHS